MSLISEKTIDGFATWAKANVDKNIFPKIHDKDDSYYKDREQEKTYLLEYSFRNMSELKQDLELYSGLETDLSVLTQLIVEICRNRSSYEEERNAEKSDRPKDRISTVPEQMFEKPCRSLIDDRTIEEFWIWAKENENNYVFPGVSYEEDSYYTNKNEEETYLVEYSFPNMAWLKEALEKYSGLSADSSILKRLTIEICRNRVQSDIVMHEHTAVKEKEEKTREGKKTLPEFVYVF